MAPPGYLNCGCTFEQALFEESLRVSRHGTRYGYRDGDFERDPRTGNWLEDEGAEKWEQKAASGGVY
ncbi:uncharacterized protein TRAVEDRAFT_53577 [Trametes versicolor FP-101664 SS1]|uniref:uncharacterized protein n=1 Tax=Trametes versicolor (strain FP-101664) TaxID=717944 RepID=UPI000462347F|nr:uncharacterized protein TRAVEDRAFT_53577 [Trametes versicolor FP-101664 SS1]EIW52149.1 hypothetical protein TRAVEDRAFT_53577 [Trametes versicolor FP-101664 SS1]